MIALVLSYFDLKTGPSFLVTAPESFNEQILIEIPKLLDVYDKGFSIQIFESYKSANLQFRIESEKARGGKENLLLSIITDNKFYLNTNIAKEILIEIENEIKELKDAYMACHTEYNELYEKMVIKIRKIIYKYYDSIQSTIRALERAEIRYQTLFKSARDAIFLINKRSSKIIDANQEGICLLQKRKEDIIGKAFDEVFKVERRNSLFEQIITHIDTNQLDLITTFLINQSGHKIGVEINTSIVQMGSEIIIQCIIRNISKRLEAEEKLKTSEEKYRLTIENANDLIKVLNSKFEYEELNENIHKRVLGYSKDELLYKSPMAHVHPEDRKRSSLLLSKILRKGMGSFQARFKHKNGSIKWLEVSAKSFVDSTGNKKYITVGRDITDRKLAEEKLRESEEKYRSLIDGLSQTGIGIDIVDSNHNIIFQNLFLKDLFGDHRNKKCFKLYFGRENCCEGCPMMISIQNNKIEKAIITAPNNRTYEIISAPLSNPDKNVKHAAEVIIDITDRVKSEQNLKDSEEKYRLITENAFDFITVVDMNLKHLFINESRYKEILGYTNEDLIGKSILEFIHPDDIPRVIKNRAKGLKTGKIEGATIRIKKKDGGWLWIETRSRIFPTNSDSIKAVIISRDVTEKINSNQIQKDSQNKVNRFLQLLTVDLYNILNRIKNSSQKLEASKQEPRKNIKEIEVIKTQVNIGLTLLSKQKESIF